MTHSVGIYLFDEVEVLDFAGPFEVFSTASRVKARLTPEAERPFEVFTVSDRIRTVQARAGLQVRPAFDFTTHPPIDILVIPGGEVGVEIGRAEVIEWIERCAAGARLTASVCTGAFLLAKAGLLNGKQATTHWEDIPDMQATFPEVHVKEGERWVAADGVITSAGISAGLDMSLHLVAALEGEALALRTARQIDYAWRSVSG